VVELMQTRAAEAEVKLTFTRSETLQPFYFDPDLLHRAVLNIVTNAIDACEKRPGAQVDVGIELDPEGHLVQILVSDNGEGIPQEDLGRIFSVFESKKGARGTGLGLPVSQKILREHGGDIRVESTPGAGSRFSLELPLVQQAPTKGNEVSAARETTV
jgi:two-component system NtrC family sensor kinase